MSGPLANARHEIFCLNIVKGQDPLEAYENAGYEPAASNASKLRWQPHINARIIELQTKAANRVEITASRVLEALGNIAFFNPGDCIQVSESGEIEVDLSALTKDQAAALDIATETDDEGKTRVRVKLADVASRKSALELLGKRFGLWIDRQETGKPGDFTEVQTTDELMAKLREDLGHEDAEKFAALMEQHKPERLN